MSKKYKIILGGIIAAFFACFIYSFIDREFDFITYVAGLSSFFVALLTVVYVYTTNEQLKMMNKQLIQMEKEQKQQQQPFPYINKVELEIEKPRFFYTPPEDEYSCQSRYCIIANIGNLASEPAVLLDVVATIDIPQDNNIVVLDSTTKRIDVLSKEYNDKIEVNFLFSGDEKAKLFEALRNKRASEFPRLNICIYYRNLVGGCFKQKNSFYVLPEELDVINNWHIIVNSFEVEYYERLKKLRSLEKGNILRKNLFDEIKQDIIKRLEDDSIIKLETLAISKAFSIVYLNEKEYASEIDKINHYGRFIGFEAECKE